MSILAKDEVITIDELHKRLLIAALKKSGGNVFSAANLIGMQVRTAYNKIDKFKLKELIQRC